MKNLITFLLPLLFVGFLLITSCSDKDDPKPEICNNNMDDDGDGLIDCDDSDCANNSNCTTIISDLRLKQNIQNLSYGLNEILQLNAVEYEYKTEKDITRLGLIAQDAKTIIPEIVSVNDDNSMLQIRYIDLVSVLISATQQQQKLIEENRQLIETLKEMQENNASL